MFWFKRAKQHKPTHEINLIDEEILPQTDEAGVGAVKERIYRLAREHNWGDINIGISVYPEDGECAQSLLEKAGYVFPAKLKYSRGKETQSSASDMVRP